MSLRTIIIGSAVLVWAVPAAAQQRGTVEFGAFASAASFDKNLTLNSAMGGGGLIGIFLDPRLSVEIEKGEMKASRTLGLNDVNVGILNARLVGIPFVSGRLSFLIGAGAGASTETNFFLHSYGLNGLVGAKIALNDYAAIRIDAIADFLANNDWKSYQTVHIGLSLFRSPNQITRIVEVPGVAAPYVQRPDSVSAEEQERRRQAGRDYRALRDSLNRRVVDTSPASSAAALATMEEKIHFDTDKSDLSSESIALLDAKVAVFNANPSMRIVILGNTDERASDTYNMALGGRRARAAKAYLVSKGVDAVRIEISSNGERKPVAAGTSPTAEGLNRRDEFRLLIASDYLVPAKP
jgi:peptidoglycan-associated lipoprotein